MIVTAGTNRKGQRVEYRQYPSSRTSLAESRAKVFVGRKCVATGWSSDGVTWDRYQAELNPIGPRYGWTGRNFCSMGWNKGSGSSIVWFRRINGKRFMFRAWLDQDQNVKTVDAMDASSNDKRDWTGRHCFTRQLGERCSNR